MRRFFELTDDMTVADRWHLGEVHECDRTDEIALVDGVWWPGSDELCGQVHRAGRELDYTRTSFGVPVASSKLVAALDRVCRADFQRIPLRISGHSGFSVLNVLHVVACLDEVRTEFETEVLLDGTSQYGTIGKLWVSAGLIPVDVHVFRVAGWSMSIVVSDDVKRAIDASGCVGAVFEDVTG